MGEGDHWVSLEFARMHLTSHGLGRLRFNWIQLALLSPEIKLIYPGAVLDAMVGHVHRVLIGIIDSCTF